RVRPDVGRVDLRQAPTSPSNRGADRVDDVGLGHGGSLLTTRQELASNTMPDAIVERDGPLMTVTMNRPHRMNAQSGAMLARMLDAWVEASEDPEIRCIILTGAEGNF